MTTPHAVEEGLSRAAVIARIKAALERRSGKKWSVTGGTGTAYGWLTIDAPPARRTWRYRLRSGASDVSGTVAGNYVAVLDDLTCASCAWFHGRMDIVAPNQACANILTAVGCRCHTVPDVALLKQGEMQDEEDYDTGQRGGHSGPQDRAELAGLLGLDTPMIHFQGHSVAADHDYYREYIDRAEGRMPCKIATPYWD